MNCIPPLPEPGKCPICGMEMLAVYGEAAASDGGERRFSMSEEARALASIRTAPVERRWIERSVRMVGKVDYDESRLAYVTAYVGGRLDRLFVDYTGIPVRAGDHMVSLYSPELLSAQEELLAAARMNGASGSGIAGRLASDTLAAARERLRLWGLKAEQIAAIEQGGAVEDHLTIYAPIGGIVIEKHQREGAYVETGDRIYTIADLSKVWVLLKAYESDLPWLRYGQEISFTAEAAPGREFHGHTAFIGPMLDPLTRTVDVRINVDNADGTLKPEMFVRAVARSRLAKGGRIVEPSLADKWLCPMHPEIAAEEAAACPICGMDLEPAGELGFVAAADDDPPLVIPTTAPLITGKRAIVYVEIPAAATPTFEGREVVLGPRADDGYIVAQGLSEGERVVVNGAFRIDASLQIIARPSMMSAPGASAGAPQGHMEH
ncbi:MAG: Cation efflux system protein CusB precursor [candidate division BRC1 bacterium ADurb.BinA364]|nr:MAG: Cation efflux system protein CusB precursor [candidate division BRC1 bacterium ADurb.BinA364]